MDYERILREKHLKATPQRMSVLEVLYNNSHPTFEKIHELIKEKFPSISLATVYKNVSVLKNNGIIVEIDTPSGESKYDMFIKPHAHIVCEKCGFVEDFEFLDAAYKYKQELEASKQHRIKLFNITATIENCGYCAHKQTQFS